MWEKVLDYFYTRFGLRTERKRIREIDVEEDTMNDQTCKQRRLNHQYTASEQFLLPASNWRSTGTKRQHLSSNQQHRSTLSRTDPSWMAESKENIIDISDTEDVEVVGMWQDSTTLRKCPVYRGGVNRKETPANLSISDDDEIEVVKVVEPLSKEIERSGNSNTIIQTPSTRVSTLSSATNVKGSSRNPLLVQRLKMLNPSSCLEDRKPRLALNESFRLEDKVKYSELLQKYTDVPLQASVRFPRYVQKREVSSVCLDHTKRNMRKQVIDLKKPDPVTLRKHVDVRKDREHKPCMSSTRRESSDEPEVVCTVVKSNSLALSLKWNYLCDEDFISSINERFVQKIEASKKEETEEKIKAEHFKKLNKKLQMGSLERLTNYLKITDAIVEDVSLEEESKLPHLTAEMEDMINAALIPKPQNELLIEAFGLPVKRHDMQTLAGLNWLNDEVINFYMELLKERGKLKNYPSAYAFNTFFYPRLLNGGHAVLKRWTRKVDIFSFDLLIVPIHLGVHWCLAAIDFSDKTIKYYDSMGSPNNTCLQSLLKYLREESLDKKKMKFDSTGWQLENVQNIPQQMNGSDCGMFSCMYAEYICRNAKFTFTQKDMPYFRRKMVYEIFNQKLLM